MPSLACGQQINTNSLYFLIWVKNYKPLGWCAFGEGRLSHTCWNPAAMLSPVPHWPWDNWPCTLLDFITGELIPALGRDGSTPHHRHGGAGPDGMGLGVLAPLLTCRGCLNGWINQLNCHPDPHSGPWVGNPNRCPIFDLLERTKRLDLQNDNSRISTT